MIGRLGESCKITIKRIQTRTKSKYAMREDQAQCDFTVELLREIDPDYKCPHPAKKNGKCIFHLGEPVEEFNREFHFLLEELKRESIEVWDFRGFVFPIPIYWTDETFSKKLDFSFATFKEDVDFQGWTFEEDAKFGWTTFEGDGVFGGSIFRGNVAFRGSTFGGDANFRGTTLHGVASFEGSNFKGDVNFARSTFETDANFSSSTFERHATFWRSTFKGHATFGNSTFEGDFLFGVSSCEGNADFWGSTFKSNANFYESTFKGDANFWESTYQGKVDFSGSDEMKGFLDECNFTGLSFFEKTQITFHKVDLGKASFLDTDLEGVLFRDVVWARAGSRLPFLRRSVALWDEIRPIEKGEQRDYEKIAENYRQLVLNYERKRNYETAEQFHIGEMEMRRKKKGASVSPGWWRKAREWLNAYAVYKILSNYGTSYWQAFVMLILFVLLFSAAFLFSGFRPATSSPSDSTYFIEYELLSPGPEHQPVPVKQIGSDYGEAILFTLSILTFQRQRFYEPISPWSKLWLFMAVFVLTSQTALVLLAIRRRFKR